MKEVRQELEDIAKRKVDLQKLLDEAGDRLGKLRAEAQTNGQGEEEDRLGGPGLGSRTGMGNDMLMSGVEHLGLGMGMSSRGLESLGDT